MYQMKFFYPLPFLLLVFSTGYAQSGMQVIKVSKGKVMHKGKQLKKGDIIPLSKNSPLPPRTA